MNAREDIHRAGEHLLITAISNFLNKRTTARSGAWAASVGSLLSAARRYPVTVIFLDAFWHGRVDNFCHSKVVGRFVVSSLPRRAFVGHLGSKISVLWSIEIAP